MSIAAKTKKVYKTSKSQWAYQQKHKNMKQTHDNSIENEQGVETHKKTMNVTARHTKK